MRLRIPAVLLISLAVAGCSGWSQRGAGAEEDRTADLIIPPDLTAPDYSESMALPIREGDAKTELGEVAVGLKPQTGVQLKRDGSLRWLLVETSPEALWPTLRRYWQSLDMELKRDDARLGVMETIWLEGRHHLEKTGLFRRLFPGQSSADIMDKFRLRLERTPEGYSEIYLSHYRLEEQQYTDPDTGSLYTMWESRPSDPELAREQLQRLLLFLGLSEIRANAVLAEAAPPARATLVTAADGQPRLLLDEGFARAWRHTGIALDRMEMVVEDRDRAAGIYYVSLVELEQEPQTRGLFTRLLPPKEVTRTLQVHLERSGEQTFIQVRDEKGGALDAAYARGLLERLQIQLD